MDANCFHSSLILLQRVDFPLAGHPHRFKTVTNCIEDSSERITDTAILRHARPYFQPYFQFRCDYQSHWLKEQTSS